MNSVLRREFLENIGQTSPSPLMIEIERAEGVFFYTPEGKRYFDLISGVSVSNVGHANPVVVEAVCRQAQDYMHVMVYGEMVEKPQVRYAKLLADNLGAGLSSVYFVNSGAEAVEGALKLARRATGRSELISFREAYHGSTFGAMSVMGGEEYEQAFGPLLGGITRIGYNDFDDISLITEKTAGVIIEPVRGEAGVRLPDEGYLQKIRERCNETGTLLIFDEIQTGFGRTGKMFAFQHCGVAPDIVCMAKALGGGMPLGAFVASKEIMNTLTHNPVLGHITTFGGHPVCCAAGLAAMEYIIDNGLANNAETIGRLFEERLSKHTAVVEIRRAGLLLAVELGESGHMFAMMDMFQREGILSDWFLFCDTAFRISPPLVMTREEAEECCTIIEECLDRLR